MVQAVAGSNPVAHPEHPANRAVLSSTLLPRNYAGHNFALTRRVECAPFAVAFMRLRERAARPGRLLLLVRRSDLLPRWQVNRFAREGVPLKEALAFMRSSSLACYRLLGEQLPTAVPTRNRPLDAPGELVRRRTPRMRSARPRDLGDLDHYHGLRGQTAATRPGYGA